MSEKIVCIGSVLMDELFFCKEQAIDATSNPASSRTEVGGVVSNIARHLAKLGFPVEMLVPIGNDQEAQHIVSVFESEGLSLAHALYTDQTTGKYVSILNPDGSLQIAVCSDQAEKQLSVSYLQSKISVLQSAAMILCDTNIHVEVLQWLISFCFEHQVKLIIEPVSVPKAQKLYSLSLKGVFMITPNLDELFAIAQKSSHEEQAIRDLLQVGVSNIWVRKGAEGSVFYDSYTSVSLEAMPVKMSDSTGAGDAALSGWIYAHMQHFDIQSCMRFGHALAMEVIQQQGTVIKGLNPALLEAFKNKYYGSE